MPDIPPEDYERSQALLGAGFAGVREFADLLADQGELRGLIGPREIPRLWRRHVVNSAAVAQFLPDQGSVIDIGSGAGLPGVVLALMRPDLVFHLIEPMQRRVLWLNEVRDRLQLANVEVHAARAEQLHGELIAEAVTARAVAPLQKLASWALPLVRLNGSLLAMKGRRAPQEVSDALSILTRHGATHIEIKDVDVFADGDVTKVVVIQR
ncbi:MAG: 16S rRNA (guanine(527)-N(7))-methyltransferase RsmG [Beutenbergiaceae bacterium]